jgi:hypothetical protein
MDPKSLAVLASSPAPGSPMPPKGGGGAPPKKNGKGGKPPGGNPHAQAHPGMDESDETDKDESDELEGPLKDYAPLVKLLEKNAQDVEEQTEVLDSDFLNDASMSPDDETKQELEESLEALPDDLCAAMKEHLASISHDNAMAIAEHLEEEGFVSDAEPIGGYLFHVGQIVGSMGKDGGDDDDASDEEDDDGDSSDIDDE